MEFRYIIEDDPDIRGRQVQRLRRPVEMFEAMYATQAQQDNFVGKYRHQISLNLTRIRFLQSSEIILVNK